MTSSSEPTDLESSATGLRAATGDRGRASVTANSRSVASWTLISRLSGLARVGAIGAVLGPTYFGNLFQAVNQMPNLLFTLLVGPVLASLLVPPMVAMIDSGSKAQLRQFCRSLAGLTIVGLGAVALIGMLLAPLLIRLLTSGVSDPEVAAAQRSAGTVLILLVLPQLVLYTLAGIGAAVQNAHGRFAFSAAVPAVENLTVVIMIITFGVLFGTGTEVTTVAREQLLLLGFGSTAAVGLHAAAQLLGAARHGVFLFPGFKWRNPEVLEVLRLSRSASGTAVIQGARTLLALTVAGAVPGGVVAFQIATNFYQLPVAVGARPVATASLTEMARLHHAGARTELWERSQRSISLALFIAAPVAFCYLFLAEPIARVVAFGEMAAPAGIALLAVSIAARSVGVLGETVYWVCASGSFAIRDGAGPLRANLLRAGVTVLVVFTGLQIGDVSDLQLLLVLGAGLSAGDVVAGLYLYRTVWRQMSTGSYSVIRPVGITAVASLLAGAAGYGLFRTSAASPERLQDVIALGTGLATAALIYLIVQHLSGSLELAEFLKIGARVRKSSTSPDPSVERRSPDDDDNNDNDNDNDNDRSANGGPVAELATAEGAPPPTEGVAGPHRPVDARVWLTTWGQLTQRRSQASEWVGSARERIRTSTINQRLVHRAEELTVYAVLIGAAIGAVAMLTTEPVLAVGGATAAAIFVVVVMKPVAAAYLYLGLAPLLVGFDRDSVLPVLRPSEALLGLLVVGAVWRRLIRLFSGQPIRFERSRIESTIMLMAFTSSFVPLLWMAARGLRPEFVDFLYAIAIWKFYVVFILVRTVVETTKQIERCLFVVMAASAIVAVIAILQSAGIGSVLSALEQLYPTTERNLANNRGSSLLNSSHAVGDVMVINLALAMGVAYYKKWSPLLAVLALLFFVATFASGQFSAIIGLAIGAWVAGRLTKTLLASSTIALPLTAFATIAMRPIVERRLEGFSSAVGIPPSWEARWHNLNTFFWPELFSNYNFLLGVRPAARLPAPEIWRSHVFIESGHTYLLWSGGLPFFAAYVLFTIAAIRTAAATAPRRDPVGATAVAVAAGLWVVTVGMLLDVHLTLRGTADLIFPLLALLVAGRLIPPQTEGSWPPERAVEKSHLLARA